MATVEVQKLIIEILRKEKAELSMEELVARAQVDRPDKKALIRAAILPLLAIRRVELTAARKLRLASA